MRSRRRELDEFGCPVGCRSRCRPEEELDMTADLVETLREALLTAAIVASPVLLAGLLVGVLVGIVQSATGVQEPMLGQVPRLVAMVAVLMLMLPWMLDTFVELVRSTAAAP
jgi:flagellar biosynthetic protein FliQ